MFRKTSASDQEHLVISQYDVYQDKALTKAEAVSYRQHLDTCSECCTWAENQEQIAWHLANEAPAPAILSPAAAARIQKNVFSKMRRALIMNNVRKVTGAAVAFAVLALIVGIFFWQSRTLNTIDLVGDVIPKIDTDVKATPELVAVPAVTDEQLIEAVNARDAAGVEQLLKAGANADTLDSSGDPILREAIRQRNPAIARLLVENGADVNATDKEGNALLPQAAGAGELEIVRLLLEAGADVNGTMRAGSAIDSWLIPTPNSALSEAVINNHVEIVELLIAYGADVDHAEEGLSRTALHYAAFLINPEVIKILLENGADPNLPSDMNNGETALHFAVERGSSLSARALLDGGADANVQTELGLTPMMAALINHNREGDITTMFLEFGADPNIVDSNGNTALHFAAREGRTFDIPILLEHGADVNQQNHIGNTALHQAARWGQANAITILLENGASLDLENNRGQTALDMAVDDHIIELLQEASAAE